MRRTFVLLLVPPLCALGLVAASGCGVAAEDAAATVGNTTVSTTTVDELANDVEFASAVLQQTNPATDDNVLPGDLARNTLLFEIQRTALLDELHRWGITIPAGLRSQARSSIQNQVPKMSKAHLDLLVDYVVANQLLEQRLGSIDGTRSGDLRLLYEGSPALWDQVCLTAVAVPDTAKVLRAARRALDGGTALAKLSAKVKQAQVAATPKQCVSRSNLPTELRDDVANASVKELRGPVVVPGTTSVAYFYRVESDRRVSFQDARTDLGSLVKSLQQQAQQQAAAQLWMSIVLRQGVTINPRYGDALVPGAQGQLEITPPAAPLGQLPTVTVPQPTQGSGSSGSGGADSGGGAGSTGQAGTGSSTPDTSPSGSASTGSQSTP